MGHVHTLTIYLLQFAQSETATSPWLDRVFVPIVLGWTMLFGLFLWAVGVALCEGITQLKRLHQVPCDRCAYFTGSTYLKCTVHPCRAMTENAIDCRDFEPSHGQYTAQYPSVRKVHKALMR